MPRTCGSSPAARRWTSRSSTTDIGSRVSSRKRIASRTSISYGVPIDCCTSERLPPTRRPAAETPRRAPRLGGPSHVATDARRGTRRGERGEERRHRWIASARNQVVHRWPMEDAQMRAAHEPEVERGDVRVADERFRVALEDSRLEVGDHADRTVATRTADDCLDPGIQPHAHEVLCAALVLSSGEAAQRGDLGIEEHRVARALERLHSAREPTDAWRVRGCNDTDRVTLQQRSRTDEWFGRDGLDDTLPRGNRRGLGKRYRVGGVGGHVRTQDNGPAHGGASTAAEAPTYI